MSPVCHWRRRWVSLACLVVLSGCATPGPLAAPAPTAIVPGKTDVRAGVSADTASPTLAARVAEDQSAPVSAPAIAAAPAVPDSPAAPVAVAVGPLAPLPAERFSGSRARSDAQTLAVDIGSRVAGTPAQNRAADFIAAQLSAAGATVERQTFIFSSFVDRGSTLQIVRPGPGRPGVRALMYSASGDVRAEVVAAGFGRAGDFDPASVKDRIALVRRGPDGVTTFAVKARNVAEAGARAIVIVNNQAGPFGGSLGSAAAIPAVSISREDGDDLFAALEQGPLEARLTVDADVSQREGVNVVGDRAGSALRTVIVGGHFDSVSAGPGANDNASGTATMIELARATQGKAYPFRLRFIAFGAEEVGLVGSERFVAQLSPEERANTIAMVNLDMVGVGDVLNLSGDADLVEMASRHAAELGRPAHRTRSAMGTVAMASDHASFVAAGIPGLFLNWSNDPNYHTAGDTADHIDPALLGVTGQIVLRVLDDLSAGIER
ncbi:MAG: M28 family peptidase [Chloroflexi bacterium]|nr:M28 family peptidase [Chloroflexota bacterium]